MLYPVTAALGLFLFMGVVGGYLTRRRYAGTSHLPFHIHDGLRGEHRNFGLRWLAWGGALTVPLVIWAALAEPSEGGSVAVAVVLATVAVVALALMALCWSGPMPWRSRGVPVSERRTQDR